MYLHVPDNGYHAPSTVISQPTNLISAVLNIYRKRAKRKISIKEYRKIL